MARVNVKGNRDIVYSLRLTVEEKELIDSMARVEGKSFSSVIRDSVLSRANAYRKIWNEIGQKEREK